jgi:hypothetical protein
MKHSLLKPRPESVEEDFEAICSYVHDKYRGNALRRLHAIERDALTTSMHPQCNVFITIPARHNEQGLRHTLELYAQQHAAKQGPQFEVDVLINGPQGVDLFDSPAFTDAFHAYEQLGIPVNVFLATYSAQERQIGRIRRDLAVLTLRRMLNSGHANPGDAVLVTNDADARDIAPEYVSTLAQRFASNPSIAGATGFIDLPDEDFRQDHVLFAAHRMSQMIESIYRAKHPYHPLTMRGGSSAFRVRDYIRAGGHASSRISEHRHLYRSLAKDPTVCIERLPRAGATIITDARRQVATLASGRPVTNSYQNFGLPGDVAEQYQAEVPQSPGRLLDSGKFLHDLQEEVRAMFGKFVSLHQTFGEDAARQLFHRAAFFAGMKLTFDEQGRVCVDNIDALSAGIRGRWSLAMTASAAENLADATPLPTTVHSYA